MRSLECEDRRSRWGGGEGEGRTRVAAIFQKTEERKEGGESVNGIFARPEDRGRGGKEEEEKEEEEERKEEVSINSITRE